MFHASLRRAENRFLPSEIDFANAVTGENAVRKSGFMVTAKVSMTPSNAVIFFRTSVEVPVRKKRLSRGFRC